MKKRYFVLFIFCSFFIFTSNVFAAYDQISTATGCNVIPNELRDFLIWIFRIIQIAGMVITMVLGIVDFMTATASDKDDAMKKASSRFIKRVMALVILLLSPLLVNLILDLINFANNRGNQTCGIY